MQYDHTTGNLDNRLSLDEVGAVINDIIRNDTEYQKAMAAAADARVRSEDIVCGVGGSTICMVANGNVYPCAGWQDFVCGNLAEQSLRDIWEKSPHINYLRAFLRGGRAEPPHRDGLEGEVASGNMTDHHVHIGQREQYAEDVVRAWRRGEGASETVWS
jgi:hypothetical protein